MTFKPPTVEEVTAYCIERKNGIDPELWHDYYCANGWMVGRNHMKDWNAAVRTWERNGRAKKVESIPDKPVKNWIDREADNKKGAGTLSRFMEREDMPTEARQAIDKLMGRRMKA